MATQRQRSARSASPSVHRSVAPIPGQKNTFVAVKTAPVAQSGVDSDQRESLREVSRKSMFQRKVNDVLKLPNGYLNAAVLIIRWDESIDDFEGHTEEVSGISGIERMQ
jgi:hypothetical protein